MELLSTKSCLDERNEVREVFHVIFLLILCKRAKFRAVRKGSCSGYPLLTHFVICVFGRGADGGEVLVDDLYLAVVWRIT